MDAFAQQTNQTRFFSHTSWTLLTLKDHVSIRATFSPSSICLLFAVIFVFYGLSKVYNIFTSPLIEIPGPKLAASSYFYEFFYNVLKPYRYGDKIDELHQKHGKSQRS